MQKVLLHACCAVCASYSIIKLIEEGYKPIVYFYNPNIYPKKEYDIRLNELINYCEEKNIEIIIGDYDDLAFESLVSEYKNEPEKGKRCDVCFKLRLENSAQLAKKLDIELFTTTLTISPHKLTKQVFEAGQKAAQINGVKFLQCDFKKQDGFKKAQQIAKEYNMYKQNYCGCRYSIRP